MTVIDQSRQLHPTNPDANWAGPAAKLKGITLDQVPAVTASFTPEDWERLDDEHLDIIGLGVLRGLAVLGVDMDDDPIAVFSRLYLESRAARRRQEAFAETARHQTQFEATRPACPTDWCDGTCETEGHMGDAVLHESEPIVVPAEADQIGASGFVRLRAQRHDSLTEPSAGCVEVDIAGAGSLIDERAHFTAAQARMFAVELLRHADMLDPEQKVPACDVRAGVTATSPELQHIGDELLTSDGWQKVLGVYLGAYLGVADEEVTVFTPERDFASDGWLLAPEDLVQIRRHRHGSCAVRFVSLGVSR